MNHPDYQWSHAPNDVDTNVQPITARNVPQQPWPLPQQHGVRLHGHHWGCSSPGNPRIATWGPLVNGLCPQLDQWNIPTCGMKYGLHMDYKPLTKWDAHQSSGRDDVEFIGRTCWWSDKPRKSGNLDIMGYNGLKCGVGMGRKKYNQQYVHLGMCHGFLWDMYVCIYVCI